MRGDWQAGVYHNPSEPYLEHHGSQLWLRFRCPSQAPLEQAFLRCAPDGEQRMLEAVRAEPRTGWDCDWWEVVVATSVERLAYRFFLVTSQGCYWLTAAGMMRHLPTDHHDYQWLGQAEHAPGWVESSVLYQIFPDRFCPGPNGHPLRSGQHLLEGQPVVARQWHELPDPGQGAREFFGGDLWGVVSKLPYLADELGVNGLYLNPIGTSPSSHRYDVASYLEVDPLLGGEQAYLALRSATRNQGLRLMLDIVPNHCGDQHPWFRTAQADPEAPEAEFFTFREHPYEYECWLGVRTLPKLNYASSRLREQMYAGDKAIMRRWLRGPWQIDGWRIDVANMLARNGPQQLGHEVLREMRAAVKAERPEAYFLGEHFFDASSYLQGDQLDATMNYRGFMMPLLHWLCGMDYEALCGRPWGDRHPLDSPDLEIQWRNWRAALPWAVQRRQLNLLGSHDTPRIAQVLGSHRDRLSVARALLFTYPGVPCIYYGDEVGLLGGLDPDNRRPMPWDRQHWDQEGWHDWQRWVKLRRRSPALALGGVQFLVAEADTLAFLREHPEERLLVVTRRGVSRDLEALRVEAAALPEGSWWQELGTGQRQRIQQRHLSLLDVGVQIWREVRP